MGNKKKNLSPEQVVQSVRESIEAECGRLYGDLELERRAGSSPVPTIVCICICIVFDLYVGIGAFVLGNIFMGVLEVSLIIALLLSLIVISPSVKRWRKYKKLQKEYLKRTDLHKEANQASHLEYMARKEFDKILEKMQKGLGEDVK